MMRRLVSPPLVALVCLLVAGCPAPPAGQSGGTAGSGETGSGTGDELSQSALSYQGSLSGSVAAVSTTAGAEDAQAAQPVALTGDEALWLTDMRGNPLLDASGAEYAPAALNPDGTFELGQLPVGVDFMIQIDLDGDGAADLSTMVSIPKDAGGQTGALDGALVDPLSTLTGARLRRLLSARGMDPAALELSFSGLVGRVRDAYEHLLDDAGIEHRITLDEIAGLSLEQLAELFEQVVPVAARRGMRMAESNIELAAAEDVEGVVRAAAKIMIEGGFVIADDPGGIDLSFLGQLANVEKLTMRQFRERFERPGVPSESAQDVPRTYEPDIYVSTLAEVDRNYGQGGAEDQPLMLKPMFGEYMLSKIAQAYLDGKTISLADLHRLMVDVEIGLGARLTYMAGGGPDRPPVNVFESADGAGIEKDMAAFFEQISDLEQTDPHLEPMAQRAPSELRALVAEFLAGTAEPSFERVFGGILMRRVPGPEEFARHIRRQRAHLPFSRSGPSRWFVVAEADSFQNPDARPVTVDVETDDQGKVTSVVYNAGGTGEFYLGHGPFRGEGMLTELIRRSNGRLVHAHDGRKQLLDLADETIFQPVNGQSFFAAFSESGRDYPGAPALRIPNFDYDPELPPDPETNPPDFEAYVLMSEPGANGEPVRVNYADGVASYAADGQYYLLFDELTKTQGLFALIKEDGEILERTPGDRRTRVLVAAGEVQGIVLAPEQFTHVFGVDVPNPGYDPEGAPYYDDINENGAQDAGEPAFAEQHFLANPDDWRSTWVEKYYRRADNDGFPRPEEVDWESQTPKLVSGVALVPRNFRPRLNAYLFGRPNSAINLLLAFSPPEFFNGTQAIDAQTRVNPLMALALIDLAFEQVMNVEAVVDWDGPGGMPPHEQLVDAWFFVPPIDDPVALIADGFASLAQ